MIPVSVLIIAQNAQAYLKRCLDSLADFDEVVLVDGGSTDQTAEIAKSYSNVSYYLNPWPGFIAQRKFSLSKARHPWCFMIDADEAATPELVATIGEVIQRKNPKAMYRVVRTEYYEGRPIEIGFGRSAYQERLFQKSMVDYVGGVHHEHMINGKRSSLDHPDIEDLPFSVRVLHDPTYTLDDMVKKLPRFSLLIAQEKFEQGRRVSGLEVVMIFCVTFIKVYGKSWRAGRVGLMTSLMEAYHRGLVKLVIYNLQHFRSSKLDEQWRSKKLG